ncbi:hypothetical protein K431DRAFT_285905 [Polychaeton citri CBS 116435]|uniref:Uncharacterized protein n=1 Tax=Polychaeton citri CBS 116435 TaxID=1314669 RepID=A0A9P4Q5M6_9PEZI|nr:hypothetical protein K431DRAFT_285905 [Polychaeton citri CBS 116435]
MQQPSFTHLEATLEASSHSYVCCLVIIGVLSLILKTIDSRRQDDPKENGKRRSLIT